MLNIIMKVLTSSGYEPMYPFNPAQILNGTFETSSTASQYNLTVTGLPSPITSSFGNSMGIISFIPTLNNNDNIRISLNGDSSLPLLFSDGIPVRANTLIAGRIVFVKYYNNNFYLIVDKNQIGLSNVDNTADLDKPISTATQAALNNKLDIPAQIPNNSNLNSYTTAGLYYISSNSSASTINNSPVSVAFSLFVEKHSGVKQTLTAYTNSGVKTYVRNFYNGTWSTWYQQAFIITGTSDPANNIGEDGNIYIKTEN